jgi:hypothetical protein
MEGYFSNDAKLQIPVTLVTESNSLAMRTSIASLQTTGSTNLATKCAAVNK